eukprot:982871_1
MCTTLGVIDTYLQNNTPPWLFKMECMVDKIASQFKVLINTCKIKNAVVDLLSSRFTCRTRSSSNVVVFTSCLTSTIEMALCLPPIRPSTLSYFPYKLTG